MRTNFTSFDSQEITSGSSYFSHTRTILSVTYPNLVRQRLKDRAEPMFGISNMSGNKFNLQKIPNLCVLLFKELTSLKIYALNISTMLNTTVMKH